jgi:hypothetical protein
MDFGEGTSRYLSLVMMMQTADFRHLPGWPELGWLNRSGFRRLHLQRSVGPPVRIIRDVGTKDAAKMSLVEHDHLVETLASDAADNPLHIRILPRAARCNLHLFDPQIRDAVLEIGTVDGVVGELLCELLTAAVLHG